MANLFTTKVYSGTFIIINWHNECHIQRCGTVNMSWLDWYSNNSYNSNNNKPAHTITKMCFSNKWRLAQWVCAWVYLWHYSYRWEVTQSLYGKVPPHAACDIHFSRIALPCDAAVPSLFREGIASAHRFVVKMHIGNIHAKSAFGLVQKNEKGPKQTHTNATHRVVF